MTTNEWPFPADVTRSVLDRLLRGWEILDDHGTMRWYKGPESEFDDVVRFYDEATEQEIALIRWAETGKL